MQLDSKASRVPWQVDARKRTFGRETGHWSSMADDLGESVKLALPSWHTIKINVKPKISLRLPVAFAYSLCPGALPSLCASAFAVEVEFIDKNPGPFRAKNSAEP